MPAEAVSSHCGDSRDPAMLDHTSSTASGASDIAARWSKTRHEIAST